MDRQRMNLVLAASWAAQFPKTADHADIDLSPIIGVSPELFETQQGSDDFPDSAPMPDVPETIGEGSWVGKVAMCDIIDVKKQRRTGQQIEVKVLETRSYQGEVQSARVHAVLPNGHDKYIWVQAQYLHPKKTESKD